MFKNLKAEVLGMKYDYHYKKAKHYLDKFENNRSNVLKAERMWEKFQYHTAKDYELIDEILQVRGI